MIQGLGGVLANAGRLVARHWPALLVLGLVAAAARSAALWAAVKVSDTSGQLAQVFLIAAPLAFLVPFVGMLVVCRGSLQPVRLVDIAVSVLVPFLGVYQASGLLEEDVSRFRNLAAFDEFNRFSLTEKLDFDYAGRLGILSLQVALVVVAAAWVLRWLLGEAEKRSGLVALAFVGALVEVYYTFQLAGQTIVFKTDGVAWLRDRVAVRWFEDGYDAVLDALGFLAAPFDRVMGAVAGVLSSFDAVVVLPVSWMAVAAVVLGHQLPDVSAAEAGEEAERPHGLVRSLLADVRARFSPLVDGLKLLASAGLAPMLVFSLALVVVGRVPVWVSLAARELLGPMTTQNWLVLAPLERSLGLALWLALTAPLVAAAVEWLVARQVAPTTSAPVAQGAGSST